MAKRKPLSMNQAKWLRRANTKLIERKIRDMRGLEDFQAIINFAGQQTKVDWDTSIALLHMVYGWMPTMLRPIVPHAEEDKNKLVNLLNRVKNNEDLTLEELGDVQIFANGSVIGASKLLHVLSPNNYAIWDSRVAKSFLWREVTRQTYSTLQRYKEYLNAIREWSGNQEVHCKCQYLRNINPGLSSSSNLRIIEFILFLK